MRSKVPSPDEEPSAQRRSLGRRGVSGAAPHDRIPRRALGQCDRVPASHVEGGPAVDGTTDPPDGFPQHACGVSTPIPSATGVGASGIATVGARSGGGRLRTGPLMGEGHDPWISRSVGLTSERGPSALPRFDDAEPGRLGFDRTPQPLGPEISVYALRDQGEKLSESKGGVGMGVENLFGGAGDGVHVSLQEFMSGALTNLLDPAGHGHAQLGHLAPLHQEVVPD
jgi:hypothetical protein